MLKFAITGKDALKFAITGKDALKFAITGKDALKFAITGKDGINGYYHMIGFPISLIGNKTVLKLLLSPEST